MKHLPISAVATLALAISAYGNANAQQDNRINSDTIMNEQLNLTSEWDKVFPQSDKVPHSKVTFHNRYGITLAGGVVDPLPEDAAFFVKDYYDYYKTSRGYHPRSLNSNNGWNLTSSLSFINMPILSYSDEIRSAVLLVHGEKAHSRYFSEDVFKGLKGENKELLIVPGASHTDLYDKTDVIPFDRIVSFYNEYLK